MIKRGSLKLMLHTLVESVSIYKWQKRSQQNVLEIDVLEIEIVEILCFEIGWLSAVSNILRYFCEEKFFFGVRNDSTDLIEQLQSKLL